MSEPTTERLARERLLAREYQRCALTFDAAEREWARMLGEIIMLGLDRTVVETAARNLCDRLLEELQERGKSVLAEARALSRKGV